MKNEYWFAVLFFFLLFGCSSEMEQEPLQRFSEEYETNVVGENNGDLFLFNYKSSDSLGTVINLSENLDIRGVFLTLRQVEDELSFFSFRDGFFSLAKKNIETGENEIFPNFYEDTPIRSIVWGTTTRDDVYLGTFAPSGTRNLSLYNAPTNTAEGTDFPLEFNIQNLYQPLYYKDKLFVTYFDGNASFKVVVFDTAQRQVIRTFNFGLESPSLFITAEGNLGIIIRNPSQGLRLSIFDFDTLMEVEIYDLEINQSFLPGELQNTFYVENKLVFSFSYAQPSPINFGPGVYDVEKKELFLVDLISLVASEQERLGRNITIVSQGYSMDQSLFLIGYVESNTQGTKGGIFVISTEGELMDTIETNFAPVYFVQD
ncbi:MAG: hypothetical protein AAGC45_06895 [Bacteroidota bacterium]